MKKHFLKALVAVGLITTLNSCTKDDEIQPKEKNILQTSLNDDLPPYNPLDPNGFGYIPSEDGELYYYRDSVTSFGQAENRKYLAFKPLSLAKYKNGELLDSVCNKDLALRFESKARKTHNKEVKWGNKPVVADEFAPIITLSMGNTMTIKFSKMVTAFGFEFNSPFKGFGYGITTAFRNSKLNKQLRPSYTSYLTESSVTKPLIGMTGGATLRASESQTPFDEITITFGTGFSAPTLNPPYDISLGGFRYKLAK
ncbi:hypothetical protein ACTHQF_14690 [Pedobacter sp. SAFR-022]|uniref:hypothetical protein n=1 Tax=Pedobacter sp. SAFR-022 TaxID=3436861 RepID=UPI003F7EF405